MLALSVAAVKCRDSDSSGRKLILVTVREDKSSSWLGSMAVGNRHCGRSRQLRTHPSNEGTRESELEMEQGDVVSNLAPGDRLPPARLHCLNLSDSAGN